jgi:hypothetical protein
MSAIESRHATSWPLAIDESNSSTGVLGNILPPGPLSLFHEYCRMEECIKLSLIGTPLHSAIITKSISIANKMEISNFVANARIRNKSDFSNFQKMINIFFLHASTKAQEHFFSYILNKEDDFLTAIISEIPISTTHLNLSRCKPLRDYHVQSMMGRLNNLKSVNFSRCNFLTDASAIAIAGKPRSIYKNSNELEETNLRSVNLMKCHRLTNIAAKAIAIGSNTAGLRNLKLAWCPKITDEGVQALISSPSLTKLQRVNLKGCTVTIIARNAIANMIKQNIQN